MVPGVGGNVLIFARLARLLGLDQPFYGLQPRGLDGKEAPFISVPEMARHYITEIRLCRPQGPYVIIGACTGGLVAYEMAQQLVEQEEAITLIMMNSWHPASYLHHRDKWPMMAFVAAIDALDDHAHLSRDPAHAHERLVGGRTAQMREILVRFSKFD